MGNFKTNTLSIPKTLQNKIQNDTNNTNNNNDSNNFKDDYDVKYLNINNSNLYELPNDIKLYKNLDTLDCSYNKLTQLNNLPNSIKKLICSHNKLIRLDNLVCSNISWSYIWAFCSFVII